jgi:pyruvate dehydrogenase (quinone)
VPPIPPHVTYDQMKSTAEVIIKGDLFAEIAKNKAAELLPHTSPDIAVCLP